MSENDTIDRVARILEGEEDIPTRVTSGMLMLAIKQMRDDQKEEYGKLSGELTGIKTQLDELKKNTMVKLGVFWQSYRGLAWFLMITIFVLANLWFVAPFRVALLQAAGAPDEIVEWFKIGN